MNWMRRLKLQMQVSIDGMVGVESGDHFNWDEEVRQYPIANAVNVDCILLGRKTATGFIPHWKSVAAHPKDPVVTTASLGRFPNLRRPTPQ
jgi:hypothetical protein